MDDESEFSRYRLLYGELQQRVEHLAALRRSTSDLQSRLARLNAHLSALKAVGPRECAQCGQPYVGGPDDPRCPACRGE